MSKHETLDAVVYLARVAKPGPPGLPNIESSDDLDALDLEIIAALSVDQDATIRSIAERTGKGVGTVWARIQRIRKSDWVEEMRRELRALTPKLLAAVDDGMQHGEYKDRAIVARDLLYGLGVLRRSQDINAAVTTLPTTPKQVLDALDNFSTADLREYVRLERERRGSQAAGSQSSDVVDGAQSSPDTPGPSA